MKIKKSHLNKDDKDFKQIKSKAEGIEKEAKGLVNRDKKEKKK